MVVLKLNKKSMSWEEQPKHTRGCLQLNDYYRSMLDDVKKVVTTQDRDWMCIFAGNVGDGKSTLMSQTLAYLDPTFDHTRMCQTEEDFKKKIQTLKSFQSIALDEAFDSLSSTQVAQRGHKLFVNLLQVVRQQNLFIGLSLPNFFDLNKTTAIFRSRCLVIVYSNEGARSFFSLFNKDKKKLLYIRGKKNLDDGCVNPNFRGRFNKHMQIDEEKYRILKRKAFEEREKTHKGKNVAKVTRDKAIKKLKKEGKNISEISELFDLTESSIRYIIKGQR